MILQYHEIPALYLTWWIIAIGGYHQTQGITFPHTSFSSTSARVFPK